MKKNSISFLYLLSVLLFAACFFSLKVKPDLAVNVSFTFSVLAGLVLGVVIALNIKPNIAKIINDKITLFLNSFSDGWLFWVMTSIAIALGWAQLPDIYEGIGIYILTISVGLIAWKYIFKN